MTEGSGSCLCEQSSMLLQCRRISFSVVQLRGAYFEKQLLCCENGAKGILLFLEPFRPLSGRNCVEASREDLAAEEPVRPWRGELGQEWHRGGAESFAVHSEKR